MKKAKFLLTVAAIFTMGIVACGQKQEPQESSEEPTSSISSKKSSSKSSSSKKSSSSTSKEPSSVAPANPFLTVLERNWTEGTPATNSDGKEYIPLTDATLNKVGVKISIKNYTVEDDAVEGTELGSDGKIAPVNEHSAILTYKITAPKAGEYQLVMRGKCSSSATERTLSERHFTVTLNGEAVDVVSDRVSLTTDTADFVGAPTVNLTGQEDTIKITCPDYRIVFDVNSFLIFSEH